MLRMLGSVNDHLDKIKPRGAQRVNIWCHTCHRGRPKPMTPGEELGASYKQNGLEVLLANLWGLTCEGQFLACPGTGP